MPASDILTPEDARHLLRRTGFGPTARDLLPYVGLSRGAAADRLLSYRPANVLLRGTTHEELHAAWIKYALKAQSGLQEKLTLFWHDHFATGISKVGDPLYMAHQNRLFRTAGKGSFKDLVKAVNRDTAMVEWLDTNLNVRQRPNENYARELMELFTLGVVDVAGKTNYAEQDVAQIARAFTGWHRVVYYVNGVQRRGGTLFEPFRHEYYFAADGSVADEFGRGPKVVFATPVDRPDPPGDIPPALRAYAPARAAEGAAEIDTVTDILFLHRDSQGYGTVARRIARRLIEYFAHPDPSLAFVDDVVSLSGFGTGDAWDIAALLKQIFVHDDFYPRTNPGKRASVKWPVDLLLQTLRVLGAKPRKREQYVGIPYGQPAISLLADMGQVLFEPPSVFGWDWETGWVSTSGVLARASMANGLLWDRAGIRPERIISRTLTDPAAILDALATALGVDARLTADARAALLAFLTDDGAVTSLDLRNPFGPDYARVRTLVTLILQSPAYQVH